MNKDCKYLKTENGKCPICFDIITELCNPSTCSHDFCKDCLFNWTKDTGSNCPICKVYFNEIILFTFSEKIYIPLEDNDDLNDYSDNNNYNDYRTSDECMVCGLANDEPNLLICDFCSYNICHTYCDNLDSIPVGDWICSECIKTIGKLVT